MRGRGLMNVHPVMKIRGKYGICVTHRWTMGGLNGVSATSANEPKRYGDGEHDAYADENSALQVHGEKGSLGV